MCFAFAAGFNLISWKKSLTRIGVQSSYPVVK